MKATLNDLLNAKGVSEPLREAVKVLTDRLEAAEKDVTLKERIIDSLGSELNAVANERDALRAKIEAMERQEPVAWLHETRRDSDVVTTAVKHVWGKTVVGAMAAYSIPLYLAPGAQPAPSVPDCWIPVPEKHPTFDPVDLQLSDGSVLCGCVPQSDGDYWWEGPSGEVFIDPKYASVTHWRLAAAPEAKK